MTIVMPSESSSLSNGDFAAAADVPNGVKLSATENGDTPMEPQESSPEDQDSKSTDENEDSLFCEKPSQTFLLGAEKNLLDPDVEYKGVLEMLKELTVDEKRRLPDPRMLIRHYRAEQGDVKKALPKLRDALQWRKEFGVEDLLVAMPPGEVETQNEELAEMLLQENESGKVYVRGYDRQGRALLYMRPARENTHVELNNMHHLVWNLEKAIACTARKSAALNPNGIPLEKVNLLIDYEGFKLKNAPPMSTTKFTLDILQKHYPERMYKAYFFNPPFVFRVFWNMAKPFVDPVTKEKIVFCSGKEGIAKLIAAVEDVHKLEPVGGGDNAREFDSIEYMNLPFNVSFDE